MEQIQQGEALRHHNKRETRLTPNPLDNHMPQSEKRLASDQPISDGTQILTAES